MTIVAKYWPGDQERLYTSMWAGAVCDFLLQQLRFGSNTIDISHTIAMAVHIQDGRNPYARMGESDI